MEIYDRCVSLCGALMTNYQSRGYCNIDQSYIVEPLRKYYKIIQVGQYQRSVHAFIDKKTGDVYKPAGWNGPAKIARFNLVKEFDEVLQKADCFGSYLYLR
jgi:hypothetical protein